VGKNRAVWGLVGALVAIVAFRVPATHAATPTPGTFISWTPALSATSINPSQHAVAPKLGTDGVDFGRYTEIGHLVTAYFSITFGNGSNPGSGAYRVSLPLPIVRAARLHGVAVGYGHEHDVDQGYIGLGPGAYRNVVFHVNTNVDNLHAGIVIGENPEAATPADPNIDLSPMFDGIETDQTSNDAPWVWAPGDEITGVLTYEAA